MAHATGEPMVCVVHPGGARCMVAAAFLQSQKSRATWKRRCEECTLAKIQLPTSAAVDIEAVLSAAKAAFVEAEPERAADAAEGGGEAAGVGAAAAAEARATAAR